MNEKLARFYFEDLKKTEISKFDRAKIIKDYKDKNKLSIREFAVKFHIPRSTVEDWLLYNRIPEKDYKELISQGYNHKQLYKLLRENKTVEFKVDSKIDAYLKANAGIVKTLINSRPVFTDQTKELLHGLRNQLNRLEMKLDLKKD